MEQENREKLSQDSAEREGESKEANSTHLSNSKKENGTEEARPNGMETLKTKSEGKDEEKEEGDERQSNERLSDIEIGEEESEGEANGVETNGITDESDGETETSPKVNGENGLLRPNSNLPQPEAPPGLTKSASDGEDYNKLERSLSATDSISFGKFLRDRGNSFSASIIKRIVSLKESDGKDGRWNGHDRFSDVTEFHLSGTKVIVQLKKKDDDSGMDSDLDLNLKGRISFFSRSGCRDCTAVRHFFREKGLKFVEINVDVYREREKELIRRTGGSSVPQIFFNEKLYGGLVALNALRNSGEFDKRLKEQLGKRCPDTAPAAPVYGFDDPGEEERTDEMVGMVRILRQRLPIQDRLAKMKMIKNCFSGSEMVEVMINHLDCGRKKAVEIGKVLARKHFIHHVFQENDFEDGNHLYRFLEHEPTIPRCFNFRGSTNDSEPKPAAVVGKKLTKIMTAILEAYASEDRRHVDYTCISKSEEFRRYVNLVQDLQRVDVLALSQHERLAFFMNLYNAMVIHAGIRIGRPEGVIDRRAFFGDFYYIIGGYPYSLTTIKNGILRCNQRQPYSLVKPFNAGDKRLEVAVHKINPLIHFGTCNGTRSSPPVRFFSAEGVEAELRVAAREFFHGGGIEVNLEKRNVYLSKILKWYSIDFGHEKDILKWILNYLDASKAGLLTHLLNDGGPINLVYQKYDWSVNS